MRHPCCWALALVALALVNPSLTAPLQAQGNESPLVGKPAPDIKGTFAINGKPTSLSDLKGKVVLVDFWAVWCGPCIATFPHLREWNKEFKDDGLAIVGVTTYFQKYSFDKDSGKLKAATQPGGLNETNEQEMLKDFVDHYNLRHLILPVSKDEWNKVGKDYGIRGIPMAVLIDQEGIVRMVRVGSGEANARALEAEIRKLLKKEKQ